MPVAGWAVRMLWQDGPLAISETYIWNTPLDDPVAIVYPAATTLMKLRTALMGQGVVPVSFRLSLLGSFRTYINSDPKDVQTLPTGPLALTTVPNAAEVAAGIGAVVDGSADQAPAAVLMNFFSTPQTHGRKFLSGIPDVMIRENPSGPWIVGVPSWKTLFDAFASVLTGAPNKWSFRARTLPNVAPWQPVQSTAFTFNATSGLWGVTVPTLAAPIAVGSKIQLRGFKMSSRAYIPANGTYQIDSIVAGSVGGTSIYYLRGSQTVAGTEVLVLGTVQGVDYSTFVFKSVTPGAETTHKRGNRSLAAPGRRKVLARVSG